MRDIKNALKCLNVLAPANDGSGDTAHVCTVVDMQGFNALLFLILTGSLADADATFTALLEESDDNSTFAAVDDKDMNGTEVLASFTFADDNSVKTLGYVGAKRYVRLTITPANNTGNQFMSVAAIKSKATIQPIS